MELEGRIFVLGCGNPLFGDDGFGPATIEHLKTHYGSSLGGRVVALDMGTAVRDFLFDVLLSPSRPRGIIIVDCVRDEGRTPGEVFEIDLEEISPEKVSDFSLHQFPTTNLLMELRSYTDVEIKVFVVQARCIPQEVSPGLTPEVEGAIFKMCEKILKQCEVWL